jgi:predicted RNase H-like HicB family nuclease
MRKRPKTSRPKAPAPKGVRPRDYSVVIQRDDDGWYVASVPELPGCHTQAKSLDTLDKRIREAIAAYVEAFGKPAGARFVGVQRVAV